MRYGGDYYFEMESPSLFANGRLILGPRAGFYNSVAQTFGFGDTESFELPPIPAGKIVSVKGTAGGEVQIVLLRKTEVVVFNKGDLDAGKVALSRNGFWVTEKPAPLGPGQTNAIFSGKDVPFQDVQQVIGAIMESGVAIKSVQIGLALKSGRNSEVQIGEDKACGSSALIPPEAYQKMMAAANETELSLAIRPYSCGRLAAAPASPVVNRVGSPGRSNATSKR